MTDREACQPIELAASLRAVESGWKVQHFEGKKVRLHAPFQPLRDKQLGVSFRPSTAGRQGRIFFLFSPFDQTKPSLIFTVAAFSFFPSAYHPMRVYSSLLGCILTTATTVIYSIRSVVVGHF